MRTTLLMRVVALAAMILLPLTLLPSANAEFEYRRDGRGEARPSDGDVKAITVNHFGRFAYIRVVYRETGPTSGDPEQLQIQIDRPDKRVRWEYDLWTSMHYPNTFAVWRRSDSLDDKPMCQGRRYNDGNVVRLAVPRHCFGWATWIRVRVGYSDDDIQFGSWDESPWTAWARRN